MANNKNVTAEQVEVFMINLDGVREECRTIEDAIGKCKVDDVPKIGEYARDLIVFARDLNQAAIRFFNRHDIQVMQRTTKSLREQIEAEAKEEGR